MTWRFVFSIRGNVNRVSGKSEVSGGVPVHQEEADARLQVVEGRFIPAHHSGTEKGGRGQTANVLILNKGIKTKVSRACFVIEVLLTF